MSLLTAVVLAQALSANVGARTEARVRRNSDEAPTIDGEAQATASLLFAAPRLSWRLSYSPTMSLLAVGEPSTSTTTVHSVSMGERFVLTRQTTLEFGESAEYGRENFRVLTISAPSAAAPTGAGQGGGGAPAVLPGAESQVSAETVEQTTRYGSVSVGARLSHRSSRRWSERIFAGYRASGGLGVVSRTRLPRMDVTTAGAGVSYAASRRDGLGLEATAMRMRMTSIAVADGVSFEESWTHQWERQTSVRLAFDQALWRWAAWGDAPDRPAATLIFLGANALVSHTEPLGRNRRLTVSLEERVAPEIDRMLGTANQQSTTTLTVDATIQRVLMRASGDVTVTDDNMARSTRFSYGAFESVGFPLSERFLFEVGARQSAFAGGDEESVTTSWSAYCALAYTSEVMRF